MATQPNQIPSIDEINKYSVNRLGQYEGIRQSLYDFQTYDAAGTTQMTFFQVPKGQNGKTQFDTNMQQAGSLPSPQIFVVQSIEIHFVPGVVPVVADVTGDFTAPNYINDVARVARSGWLELFIGSKAYLQEAPLGRFPPKTFLNTMAALSEDTQSAANAMSAEYASFGGRPYAINPWIKLEPTQNFNVNLNWPAAVALPSGVDGRIGVVLDGILYRLSQ